MAMALLTNNSKSKTESFAATLRHKLNVLGCPYTEDLSEDSVSDIVLSIGEGRLQILQWLMSQYHPKLADILEPSHTTLTWKSDSKLQKILMAASVMCLCSCDDISLIRGEGPVVKQMAFINKLVDLVLSKCADSDSHVSLNGAQCNQYINTLAGSESLADMMTEASLDLLPKDIRAEVDQLNKENPQQPDLKFLLTQCQNLSQEQEKQSQALQLAQSAYSVQTPDQQTDAMAMSHLLSSAVRELSQLASGFNNCFESHIGMWCEKEVPELNNLGPAFKRVDTGLQQFFTLLEEVGKIRQVKGELEKSVKEKTVRSLVSAHESQGGSNSFEDCLGILEEATHRLEAGFKSMYKPLLTL